MYNLSHYDIGAEVIGLLVKELIIAYFLCDHAAPAFGAKNIHGFSGKKHESA
jgi:hypothetical protein